MHPLGNAYNALGLQQHQRQESDPSSSSMSGLDLHNIVNQAHNKLNYVQNNVLKRSAIDTSQQS